MIAEHPINYWALGGEHDRRMLSCTPATAHYSGSPQGRRPQESGLHGCSLIQVDEAMRVRTTFIPTDAVRYQPEHVTMHEFTGADQLLQILNERIGELLGDPFGPDLLIHWAVAASRSLAAELRRTANYRPTWLLA